jgi:chromosome segregation ATPase
MSIEKIQLRKKLSSQKAALNAEITAIKSEISMKSRELTQKERHRNEISTQLAKLDQEDTLKVSEHAYLRYFERILGFNLKDIEGKMLTDDVKRMISTLGNSGEYPAGDFSVRLKNGVVVTVIPNKNQ